jgi:hypothetical protein
VSRFADCRLSTDARAVAATIALGIADAWWFGLEPLPVEMTMSQLARIHLPVLTGAQEDAEGRALSARLPVVVWSDSDGVTLECLAMPGSLVRSRTMKEALLELRKRVEERLRNGDSPVPTRVLYTTFDRGEQAIELPGQWLR